MQCEKCSREIPADSAFCPYCGEAVHPSKKETAAEEAQKAAMPPAAEETPGGEEAAPVTEGSAEKTEPAPAAAQTPVQGKEAEESVSPAGAPGGPIRYTASAQGNPPVKKRSSSGAAIAVLVGIALIAAALIFALVRMIPNSKPLVSKPDPEERPGFSGSAEELPPGVIDIERPGMDGCDSCPEVLGFSWFTTPGQFAEEASERGLSFELYDEDEDEDLYRCYGDFSLYGCEIQVIQAEFEENRLTGLALLVETPYDETVELYRSRYGYGTNEWSDDGMNENVVFHGFETRWYDVYIAADDSQLENGEASVSFYPTHAAGDDWLIANYQNGTAYDPFGLAQSGGILEKEELLESRLLLLLNQMDEDDVDIDTEANAYSVWEQWAFGSDGKSSVSVDFEFSPDLKVSDIYYRFFTYDDGETALSLLSEMNGDMLFDSAGYIDAYGDYELKGLSLKEFQEKLTEKTENICLAYFQKDDIFAVMMTTRYLDLDEDAVHISIGFWKEDGSEMI